MDTLYQITAKDLRAYTTNIVDCDELCAIIISNGYKPHIKRMRRSQVPMCDLKLVNGLKR